MASTLRLSGVFTGAPTNSSEDLIPPYDLYDACRLMGRHVRYRGSYQWDFEALHQVEIDDIFIALAESFLSSLVNNTRPYCGWKLPETNLIFPWIVRLLPGIRYIYWVRDPRDSILGAHRTDDIRRFNVPFKAPADMLEMRAASWKYQYDIVKATPAPRQFVIVRFEDFVLNQGRELERLGEFLNLKLVRVPVDHSRVGVWRNHPQYREVPFLTSAMSELGYLS
ncbi:MAG TPA: sulfotransferase [Candidatus Acidoferrales bacterium]|nr:sulfotransferase [Candidatus Acidoferrales bacterium]